jgi:hypothetical protein
MSFRMHGDAAAKRRHASGRSAVGAMSVDRDTAGFVAR